MTTQSIGFIPFKVDSVRDGRAPVWSDDDQCLVFGTVLGSPANTYTQTYSTATRTVANPTAVAVATDAATNSSPYGYGTQAQADAIVTAVNALEADCLVLIKVVTAIIDDLQSKGIVG